MTLRFGTDFGKRPFLLAVWQAVLVGGTARQRWFCRKSWLWVLAGIIRNVQESLEWKVFVNNVVHRRLSVVACWVDHCCTPPVLSCRICRMSWRGIPSDTRMIEWNYIWTGFDAERSSILRYMILWQGEERMLYIEKTGMIVQRKGYSLWRE